MSEGTARHSSRLAAFTPYVPRLVLDWERDAPGTLHRALDGTLVFVDLSGFTAMSERLARLGREGAEELTEVINSTFVELLGVAYEAGGSLLKFGGDALLLFFAGDAHPQAACFAASGMRHALRRIGRIQTTGGVVHLRMSAGVHSGTFHMFLAGDSHRELIVTGPAATRTVETEHAARAGEILLSRQTADHLPRHLGASRAPGVLLRGVPSRPDTTVDTTVRPVPGIERFIPVAIRRHHEGGGHEGTEHRQVVVAFLRFDGIDSLIEQIGTEATASKVDALVRLVQKEADDHDVCFLGTDVDADGGKIILVAGAPQTFDNDDERLLRAVREIADAPPPLPLRIGVHRGAVFAGTLGPAYRRTYTIMGDAVNTAARVMTQARPGQVLATTEVLERSRTIFRTRELEPFRAKGKSKPVVAHVVGEVAGERIRSDELQLPFTGREAEITTLRDALSVVETGGAGRAIAIVGDTGVGKSRLVEELRGRHADADTTVIESASRQYEDATPYFAMRPVLAAALGDTADALRANIRRLAPDLEPWLPLIAVPLDVDVGSSPEVDALDPAFTFARLRQTVCDGLAAALTTPTLFVFEDAEWMDDASADIVRRLCAQAPELPWLVCIVARDREAASLREAHDTLALGALSSTETEGLARVATGDTLLPQQCAALAERSGGNPLFLQELLVGALEGSSVDTLPESLEAVVAARIDTLPARDRHALRTLAVLGREFDAELTTELAEDAVVLTPSGLRRRLGEFVTLERGTVTFRQALFQEVAYAGLPYRRRRALHDRIGRALEQRTTDPDDLADALSHHFHQAHSFVRSWRYSLVAARRARSKFAHVESASLYARAVEAGRRAHADPDEIARAHLERGEELHWAARLAAAADAFGDARRSAREPVLAARVHQREGAVRMRLGDTRSAARLFGRGLAILDRAGRIEDRWRLCGAYAQLRLQQGRHRECIRWARRAVADAAVAGERVGLAHAYNAIAMALTDMRDPEAIDYTERALRIFESQGETRFAAGVLNNLANEFVERGEWDRAVDLYERSRAAQTSSGNVVNAAAVAVNMARIRSDQGRLNEAEPPLREGLATFRAAGYQSFALFVSRVLGRLCARDGRFDEAETMLDEAIAGYEALGQRGHTAEAFRAEARLFAGRTEEALRDAERILSEATGTLRPLVARIAGCALAALGRLGEARTLLEQSLDAARDAQAPYEEGLAHHALANIARPGRTEESEHDTKARETFEALGVVSVPDTAGGSGE